MLLPRASAQLSSEWVTGGLSKVKTTISCVFNVFQSGFLTFDINVSVGSISGKNLISATPQISSPSEICWNLKKKTKVHIEIPSFRLL